MSSTSNASCSQYLHHVVQNSKRTTLPLIDALLNWSPAVVLARNRGAGCPVSSLAKAHAAAIARASGNRRRISEDLTSMGRNISTSPLDRKSTRLNSSHQIISYAVFCLKKKKRKKNLIITIRRYRNN